MKKQLIYGMILLLFSTAALAHSGHALSNAYAGFIHPFMGMDHLLMMLAVGVWAAKLSGDIRWKLPVAFVIFMAVGASLGFIGFSFSGVETVVASTVIVMGVLLAINLPLSTKISVSVVAVFAAFHGLAHGLELNGSQNHSALLGMFVATAILHGIGFMVGLQREQVKHWINAGLAFSMMVVGSLFLVY